MTTIERFRQPRKPKPPGAGVMVAEQIRESRRRSRAGKGMELVAIEQDDVGLRYVRCPHCAKGFENAGDLAFVSGNQREAIHARCVVILAGSLVHGVASTQEEALEMMKQRMVNEGQFGES